MPTDPKTGRWQRKPIPDYSNQLDLFAGFGIESPDEDSEREAATNTPEVIDGQQESVGAEDPRPLDDASPEDGQGLSEEQPFRADAPRDAGEDRGSVVRTADGGEDGLPNSLGDSDQGMGIPADRGPPASTVVDEFDYGPEQQRSRDFRIVDAHRIGQGSLREKANENIAAIRTLKQVEAERRDATDSEKAQLARYTGWGALANAFLPNPPTEWQPVTRHLNLKTAVERRVRRY